MFTLFQILMFVDGFFMWNIVGQAGIFILTGGKHKNNAIYRVVSAINEPLFRPLRVLPGRPSSFSVGLLALLILFLLRLVLYMVFQYNGWIPQGISAQS